MPREVISIRLDPAVLEWATTYAATYGWSRTRLIEELLVVLREGRLDVRPRAGCDPFPANTTEPGSTPDCPAYIWVTPPPEPPRKGWTIFEVQGIGIVNPEFVRRDPETGVTYLMPTSTDTDPTEE